MVIENFSRRVVGSGILNTYVATGFFSILIFFILNSHLFTPLEMMFGTIIVTIALKGISNIMLSLVILLFNLENSKDQQQFKVAEDRLDLLLNELSMKEAKVKTVKTSQIK